LRRKKKGIGYRRWKMSAQDDYLRNQLQQILQPGEQVLHTAYMRRQPGLLMQLLLVGGLLLFLLTKAYFAVLTNRRLILIRTKMSFWSGGPKLMNLGVEEFDARQIQNVTVSGFANNRSMTFHLANAPKQTLRISPWYTKIAGTKAFFDQVPALVTSGQLAQLSAGSGSPLQMPQQHGPVPGSRVQVAAQDGNRYPATVVQVQPGHVLCVMPDGQQHWIPMQHVLPG
jgi:hypothetical protein